MRYEFLFDALLGLYFLCAISVIPIISCVFSMYAWDNLYDASFLTIFARVNFLRIGG